MTIIDTANALLKDKEDEKPTRQEAENAVKVLIEWAGDDPSREGLIETPKRVVKAFEEYFAGYNKNPQNILEKTFFETGNYQEFVLLKNIEFRSHCEHHLAPIIGYASVAYIPDGKVVGISKLARIVDVFAKRLQTQETMTSQIANSIQNNLNPKGVAVFISAEHHCMSGRGVKKAHVDMNTTFFTGDFRENQNLQNRFINSLTNK
jgi:GTP cyclohydrolase I